MKQLILPHRVSPYRCPVNGLSDIYEWKTGQRLPEQLLFDSRIGCTLISNENAKAPKMVSLGEGGIGKLQYQFWQDKIGYSMIISEDKEYEITIEEAKKLIDQEIPVILFGLDMYHLPYHKYFYKKVHVPGHVNLMVGYDNEYIYVHDNDKESVQKLTYNDLKLAWANGYMGFSKRNTFFGIDLATPNFDRKQIIGLGLLQTADEFLNALRNSMGVKGYDMLIRELPRWQEEYDKDTLYEICRYFVTFSGSMIPELPRRLQKYNSGVTNPHKGCRDTLSLALLAHQQELGNPSWQKAAEYFTKSGGLIEQVSDLFVEAMLSSDYTLLNRCADLFKEIRDNEEAAFRCFLV